ncbi:GPI mannosyltransferase 1 [Nasonia vitripennis]|uniref:GPI alpha-1,4-mannosyltransferase I, catalytic subunit n=1 Tax=Nasonia vitripennis TaxID=7425 RepID=A0A7M7M2D6_NASVI|nr:GPI mannosyltransferase 1 [Nasonia vitripennis]XP_031788389.1 GPI mannosyltransferase 1 [Nasonia vitripennis]
MTKHVAPSVKSCNKSIPKKKSMQPNTVVSLQIHCAIAFVLRLLLITYANYHDKYFKVPYTDVDYKVYTDAARHMTKGGSPYERHTYRYTPLLAMLMAPNVYLHQDCGKVFFSVVDILVAKIMRKILICQKFKPQTANLCALLWLYNPLAIVISTRGNADSLAVYFVLWTLYLLQNDQIIMTGIVHALSIHFRLYPLAFSLVMYLYLREKNLFIPNRRQLKLIIPCALALFDMTALCYAFYGKKFIDESLIYHIVRKDVRHNFSVFFYMLYLSANEGPTIVQKIFTFLPQVSILVALAFRYSTKEKLPFALFTQAITMVTFNPVMTSQYFFWFLSLLPICLPYLKMSLARTVVLLTAWILSQSLWLFAAYLLEFKGIDSFNYIWAAGMVFFAVNIKILVDLINCYKM